MLIKKLLLTISIILCTVYVSTGQITLEECQVRSRENYPLIKQHELIEKTKDYNLANIWKGYLPQLSMSAKATYQSDVASIPITIPGVNGVSKDQYSVAVELNQTIWDGGIMSSKKALINASTDVETSRLEVDLYAIRGQINQLYFGILLLDAQLEQNGLLLKELKRNHDLVASYISGGVANQSDLDVIMVEQLKARQNTATLESMRKSYISILGTMMGDAISVTEIFERPSIGEPRDFILDRPELKLMDAQQNALNAQIKGINAGYMPRLGAFITGGYGRPGLNMLQNKFDTYYMGGISLSWNFGKLYTQKNERNIISTNKNMVETQRETFLFNIDLQVNQKLDEFDNQQELLSKDYDIIELRNRIKTATGIKLENGTATTTDLIREIYAEDMAKQTKIMHEIELLKSYYELKHLTNN